MAEKELNGWDLLAAVIMILFMLFVIAVAAIVIIVLAVTKPWSILVMAGAAIVIWACARAMP